MQTPPGPGITVGGNWRAIAAYLVIAFGLSWLAFLPMIVGA
jgi:hypothetical protein